MKLKKPPFLKNRFNQPPPPIKITSYSSLVGGFNPSQKYDRQDGFIFPNLSGRNFQKSLKPQPSSPSQRSLNLVQAFHSASTRDIDHNSHPSSRKAPPEPERLSNGNPVESYRYFVEIIGKYMEIIWYPWNVASWALWCNAIVFNVLCFSSKPNCLDICKHPWTGRLFLVGSKLKKKHGNLTKGRPFPAKWPWSVHLHLTSRDNHMLMHGSG